MSSWPERLAEWDDESVVYRADDPDQKVNWPTFLLTRAVGGVAIAAVIALTHWLLPAALAMAVLFAGVFVFLVAYVLWRRRRNERLTGSPTTWPSP